MLLGTYRLQDPNGRELAALVHGNRLIKANIRTADELRDLWASPKAKDKLRKRNRNLELIPSYAENTDILDQHLREDNEDEDLDEVPELGIDIPIAGRSSKRTNEVMEEIMVRADTPPWEKPRKRKR